MVAFPNMKYQRQPSISFGPSQPTFKNKPLGPRMMKICKQVQRRQAYMPLSVTSRNIGANKREDVENIGCARKGKTYDFSKSVYEYRGHCNTVKSQKRPLGDNLDMENRNIFPIGKSKKLAVSPSTMDLQKSTPASFKKDFSSKVLGKHTLQVSKDNSGDTNKILKKPLHCSRVVASSRGLASSVEAPLVPNKVKVGSSAKENAVNRKVRFVDKHHKDQSFKEKEHKNPSSKNKCRLETEDLQGNLDVHQRIVNRNGGLPIEDCNDKLKSKGKEILEKMPREHANGVEVTTVRLVKRKRNICTVDEEDSNSDDQNLIGGDNQNIVDIDVDNQNIAGVEDDTKGLTTQTAILEQYGSLPIDEPIWSGMLKIESEGYIPLEAHLLAKSCEKVWECSKSLQNVVQVTKLSRLEAEPKCFRVLRPTEYNIGLYFFPQGMRPDKDFDKLAKEVMDNDLILRAYVGGAEMLIFSSIVLPERHQTFQGRHYLWGLFKRGEDKINVEGTKRMRGALILSGHGKENVMQRRVGREGKEKERRTALAKSNALMRPAEGATVEAATPAPAAGAATSNAPTRRPAERAAAVVATPAPAATPRAPSPTSPAERAAAETATPAPAPAVTAAALAPAPAVIAAAPAPAAIAATSSLVVPHGGGGVYFIVQANPNPRTHQLIQEIEKEGAVVFAMRGETIGHGLGRQ